MLLNMSGLIERRENLSSVSGSVSHEGYGSSVEEDHQSSEEVSNIGSEEEN